MKTQINWSVSLSNGQTLYEGKGDYQLVKNELSPWQKLQKKLTEEKLQITSLSLYTNSGQRWNLPSAGRNPKFRVFDLAEKPTGYKMFRAMGADVCNGQMEEQELYTVAEAIYENKKLQIWVSEKNPEISWSVII